MTVILIVAIEEKEGVGISVEVKPSEFESVDRTVMESIVAGDCVERLSDLYKINEDSENE